MTQKFRPNKAVMTTGGFIGEERAEGAAAPLSFIGSEFFSLSRHFSYKRHIFRRVHLR